MPVNSAHNFLGQNLLFQLFSLNHDFLIGY